MAIRVFSSLRGALAVGVAALTLAACQESSIPKDIRPVSYKLVGEMKQKGVRETAPIFVRIFKEESALEIWKERPDGKYSLIKSYNICKWSGVLGPKIKEGDRQAPEGFYTVTPAQMNPKSQYYLSFNIGFPNAFDRAHGRTGSHLMVHGACSSSGCYSMTDEDAGEIFALARDAFKGGQRAFQIQAFPFRMTPENMARHAGDANIDFWKNLKVGYDHFEVSRTVPKVDVCEKRYVFNADAGGAAFNASGACPPYQVPEAIASAVAARQTADEKKAAEIAAKSTAEAERLAAQKQKLADQRATEEAKAAARAAQPGVLTRLLGRNKEPAATPAPADAGGETAAPAPPARDTVVAASEPRAPAPKPAPAKAAATPPPPEEPAPVVTGAVAAPPPQVGQVVDREFLWPDDAPIVEGGADILGPGLGAN